MLQSFFFLSLFFFILVSGQISLSPFVVILKTHFRVRIANYEIFGANVDSDGTEFNIVEETSPLIFFLPP